MTGKKDKNLNYFRRNLREKATYKPNTQHFKQWQKKRKELNDLRKKTPSAVEGA